jgi:SAM-dependent methyltransferase
MIAKLVKRESKILEIACGIFPAIKNGIVLDKSLLLLQNIEANGNLKTVCASALSMPFSENSFDFAVSVFPPGITTDGEFFLDRHFWAELRRILSDNGVYIAVIYVLYKAKFWRFLAKMVDPLPKEFWEELDNVAFDFHIKERRISDPFGNILLVVEATKL